MNAPTLPDVIEPDGKLHRFASNGKRGDELRGDLFDKRRSFMDAWAGYLKAPDATGAVRNPFPAGQSGSVTPMAAGRVHWTRLLNRARAILATHRCGKRAEGAR